MWANKYTCPRFIFALFILGGSTALCCYAGIIPRLSLCKEEESLVSFYMCTVSRVDMTQPCRGWTKLDSMHIQSV